MVPAAASTKPARVFFRAKKLSLSSAILRIESINSSSQAVNNTSLVVQMAKSWNTGDNP